jgi:hypothetical protein
MNLQVIASPHGDIMWVSGPRPRAVHDLTAARIWGTVPELAASGLVVLGDKGYIGEDDICTPRWGRNKPAPQKETNRAHARLRSPGKRANVQLKSWRILRKLRCCPGTPGNSPKPSTSFKPAKSEDEKRSLVLPASSTVMGRALYTSLPREAQRPMHLPPSAALVLFAPSTVMGTVSTTNTNSG